MAIHNGNYSVALIAIALAFIDLALTIFFSKKIA